MTKLNKRFLKEAFRCLEPCDKWLTNGHWAVDTEHYQLPKGWEQESLKAAPDLEPILADVIKGRDTAIEWTTIKNSNGHRFGLLDNTVVLADSEYLDKLLPSGKKGIWLAEVGVIARFVLKVEGKIVAILMSCRVDSTDYQDLKKLAKVL